MIRPLLNCQNRPAVILTLATIAAFTTGCDFGKARQNALPQVAAGETSSTKESSGWVVDHAQILDESVEARITTQLQALELHTKHQLVVRTVASLNGTSIEDYSLRLANRLKIGRKDYDDGAMILIAPNERRVRIELGYGLESDIPDARAKRIVDTLMLPRFRDGAYEDAVEIGIRELVSIMEKIPEDTRAKAAEAKKNRQHKDVGPAISAAY